MRRHILWVLCWTLVTSGAAIAGTFNKTPIAPDLGLDRLDRTVSQQLVDRDLFSDPWATVTLSNVDLYDRFPYVEARDFQIVSDPRWNRLVFGERGRSLAAYDGAGSTLGPLSHPHGMAVDETNRVYVADTGNNRIVVLQASTEFGDITLEPLFAIDGLSGPFGVAYSDGGTPFVAGDDRLYVADTGRNRVVAYALVSDGARMIASLGELGSGPGRFAGPLAIAAGHVAGGAADVFVADAHTRRIVHLSQDGNTLRWVSDVGIQADIVTSLDSDEWGNLYAAAPNQGVVLKFNPELQRVAELRAGLTRPRAFHVPFLNVHDHRNGTLSRVGQPTGVSVEDWSAESGIQMWHLGTAVSDLRVAGNDTPSASFLLSDQAQVALEIRDATSGRSLAHRALGSLGAGTHTLPIADDLRSAGAEDVLVRLTATSSYSGGASDIAEASFHSGLGGGAVAPSRPVLLGNTPNPGTPSTSISFLLPVGTERASLRVFDAQGRRVRTFDSNFAPGLNQVTWDGTDDHGHAVHAGIYLYRLDVGELSFTRRMALVR